MPYRIYGCGTCYVGRSNVYFTKGECPACGEVKTVSFDTREFVCLFWIPLIPLSRVRIYKQCLLCGKHGRIAFNRYDALADRETKGVLKRIEEKPGDPALHAEHAAKLVTMGKTREAAEACRKAVELNPGDGENRFLLGYIHEVAGSDREAVSAYRRAVELAPSEYRYRFSFARLLEKRGDGREALEEFKICTELKPEEAASWLFYADLLFRFGEYGKALIAYRRLLEVFPEGEGDKGIRERMGICAEEIGA